MQNNKCGVQIHIKISDYNKDLRSSIDEIKKLIPLQPYKYWKKGDLMQTKYQKFKNIDSFYKYSTCNYMFMSDYGNVKNKIIELLNVFIPFKKKIKRVKNKYGFEITLTLVFENKEDIKSFVIDNKYLKYLSSIGADLEII